MQRCFHTPRTCCEVTKSSPRREGGDHFLQEPPLQLALQEAPPEAAERIAAASASNKKGNQGGEIIALLSFGRLVLPVEDAGLDGKGPHMSWQFPP